MPHQRKRYLEPLLLKALKHSLIVGVLGQRQTGKTTLVHRHATDYETLDNRLTLEMALAEPESFLKGRKSPFGIDECQMAPSLFPALKEAVRILPKKGQFILTGSVRFTSRKAIRESLTGRIYNLELLPLNMAESHERPLSTFLCEMQRGSIEKVLENQKIVNQLESVNATDKSFRYFLETGGLPGICFHRDEAIRANYFRTHLETLLDRDLRLIQPTTLPFALIRAVLVQLAQKQGEPIDYTQLARVSQVSVITLKKLLASFEGIFLIRRLQSVGDSKAPVFFMEDQGLATYLLKSVNASMNPALDLLRGLFTNLWPQFHYRPELVAHAYQYRTRGGAWVPMAFKTVDGHIGIIPCLSSEPSSTALGSARSYLKNTLNSKVILACQGKTIRVLDEKLLVLPYTALL